MFGEAFFDIESLKPDKQFLCVVFGEYGNYCLLFFDITLNCLKNNMHVNLLTRCDDTCVITPYLFIVLYNCCKVLLLCLIKFFFNIKSLKLDKQFLSIVFSEYGNYYLLFFDITLNCLEKNIYANLLTRCKTFIL